MNYKEMLETIYTAIEIKKCFGWVHHRIDTAKESINELKDRSK